MSAVAYLDHNATSPLRPAAFDAMVEAMRVGGNPSSVHAAGRKARAIVDKARREVASLVGASPGETVFTSGGTEANNLALLGAGRRRVLVSAVEHDSVRRAAPRAETLPVDGEGVVDLGALEVALAASPEPALVSVMLANNETGVLQPIGEVVRLARAAGALVHCDAVQGAGKVPVDMRELGVDYLSVSAHKLGGPTGVGALIVRKAAPLVPDRRGGGQESNRRHGERRRHRRFRRRCPGFWSGARCRGNARPSGTCSRPDRARREDLRRERASSRQYDLHFHARRPG